MWNCRLFLLSLFVFNSPVLMWCQNNFIIIPGGKFTPLKNWEFLSDAEQITYTVNQFQLSKYETTNEDFARFLNTVMPDSTDMALFCCGVLPPGIVYDKSSGKYNCTPGLENYPVTNVSWFGARTYCKWKGGRLPADVEWSYAAAEGKHYFTYKYSGSNIASDVAVYNNRGPSEVGTKNPNSLGLHDMSGNVSEWIENGKDSCVICKFRSFVDKDLRMASNGNWRSLQDIFLNLNTFGIFRLSNQCSNDVGFRVALN